MNVRIMTFGLIAGAAILGWQALEGQQTNAPVTMEYSSYPRYIAERNIFDPNRRGPRRGGGNEPRTRETPTFGLVGTMNYRKGQFAFFDGSSSDYKHVLEVGGKIADYTVKEVTTSSVTLEGSDGKRLEMTIGSQMRKDEENGWQLRAARDVSNASFQWNTSGGSGNGGSSQSDEPQGEANEVLRRLMEQRSKELE
jgi:hypothetical protein